MQSSNKIRRFQDSQPESLPFPHSMINTASMTREESLLSRMEVRQRNHNESKMYHASEHYMRQYQPSTTKDTTSQQPVDRFGGSSFAEFRKDAERPIYSSSSILKPANHPETASESVQGPWRDGHGDESSAPPGHKKSKFLNAVPTHPALQTAELHRRYEKLSGEYNVVQGELQDPFQLLEEKEYQIMSLNADIIDLHRRYNRRLSTLASARHEYKLCQAQLDSVQRFISTADAHADQDIIQKLQELNEEVYKISMTMADSVTEFLGRQSATVLQSKKRISIGKFVLGAIGTVMVNHLAMLEGNEDVTLLLQVAFQGYLSHVLCQIISSWTVDQRLNVLIEEMYQRLRKAETQAISGHWRALTRTHILPTYVSDPKIVVEGSMTGFSDIVAAAGLVSPQPDAMSKLWSEVGGKISSIVSHAGIFGNMVSGMITGDFEVFTVQPGAIFDRESMVDVNEVQGTPRGTEGLAQTVLCVSRVGLRKKMDEKTITLTKARVVLESFLG